MKLAVFAFMSTVTALAATPAYADDTLSSWNSGPAKRAITDFVHRVTREGSPDFVPPAERIAVFDNDGTLWSEQPLYFQAMFAMDRIRNMAPEHPEWKERQPFKGILEGDLHTALAGIEHPAVELMMVSHSGMTTDEFEADVKKWLATAKHPRFERPYTDLAYQPMLEVLAYLRSNGFKTYIVSGGGFEFMRPWVNKVYGIPPEQVIGSSIKTRFEIRGGKPVLVKLPEIDFIDDGPGKPAAIHKFIGRRPVMAFGNSDGDLQMLQWTTGAPGPRFSLVIHHTDADREWAYDVASRCGKLDKALEIAPVNGWTVVDMKKDWNVIYPFQK
jgi:phosphoserine phosphatase